MNPVDLASGVSVITPERLENVVRALKLTTHLPGDMAELGVYRGGSAKVIAAAYPDKTLHLFDTFAGLPYSETAERDPEGYSQAGMFACAQGEVERFLGDGPYRYHPGVFPESTYGLSGLRFCFVHVDCDLHAAAASAIRYFWPRLTTGGVMFFDDYGCKFTGVTEAVHDAFTPEQIVKQYEPGARVWIGCYVVKQ